MSELKLYTSRFCYENSPEMDTEKEKHKKRKWDQMIPLSSLQVENFSGGYVYTVSEYDRLARFLILGAEESKYNCTKKDILRENIECIDRLIMKNEGVKVVSILQDFSLLGRSARQSPVLKGLAISARCHDPETKNAAYRALPEICKIPTHLFEFIKYSEEESAGTGWGRQQRRAISEWYNKQEPLKLAYHITKFNKRFNWTHKDLFRLCHITPANEEIRLLVVYVIKGIVDAKNLINDYSSNKSKKILTYLEAVEKTKSFHQVTDTQSLKEVCDMIKEFRLTREHVSNHILHLKETWHALLNHMPVMAMIRNIGQMTSKGVIEPNSVAEKHVVNVLSDTERLHNAKIHPIKLLVALKTYNQETGHLGSLMWNKNKEICQALEKAFYKSFDFVKPTNKRFLLAVDVSGSMNEIVPAMPSLTIRDAAAAMVMVTLRVEKNCEVIPFSHEPPKQMDINAESKLTDIVKICSDYHFGLTDCALPMLYALKHKKEFDVFIVYTDSETYFGTTHPKTALDEYRKVMGIPKARLIVVGMSSSGFTIADPTDKYMLDVVGFDPTAPEIIYNFVNDEVPTSVKKENIHENFEFEEEII